MFFKKIHTVVPLTEKFVVKKFSFFFEWNDMSVTIALFVLFLSSIVKL